MIGVVLREATRRSRCDFLFNIQIGDSLTQAQEQQIITAHLLVAKSIF